MDAGAGGAALRFGADFHLPPVVVNTRSHCLFMSLTNRFLRVLQRVRKRDLGSFLSVATISRPESDIRG